MKNRRCGGLPNTPEPSIRSRRTGGAVTRGVRGAGEIQTRMCKP